MRKADVLWHILDIKSPPRQPLDGIDYYDVLQGEAEPPPRTLYSYTAQYGEQNESLSVTTPEWKLVRIGPNILKEDPNEPTQAEIYLFRIAEDPLEQQNLAGEHQNIVSILLQQLLEFRALEPEYTVRLFTEGREGFQAPKEWKLSEYR